MDTIINTDKVKEMLMNKIKLYRSRNKITYIDKAHEAFSYKLNISIPYSITDTCNKTLFMNELDKTKVNWHNKTFTEKSITVPTKYHAGQFLKLNSPTLKQLQKVHKGKSLYIY